MDFSGFAPYGEQRPELGVSRMPEYEPTEGEADARSPRSCPEPFELVGLKVWETFHKASSQGEESGSKARTPWLLAMGSLSDAVSTSIGTGHNMLNLQRNVLLATV